MVKQRWCVGSPGDLPWCVWSPAHAGDLERAGQPPRESRRLLVQSHLGQRSLRAPWEPSLGRSWWQKRQRNSTEGTSPSPAWPWARGEAEPELQMKAGACVSFLSSCLVAKMKLVLPITARCRIFPFLTSVPSELT